MIETNRLLLLKPSANDLDVISDILSSPEQTKYLPNEAPYSNAQKNEYLNKRIAHWENHGFGTFIFVLKDNPEMKLGFVGAEYAPNPEFIDIRFGISHVYEGQGFVTEAAKSLISWFFENTEFKKLYGVSMMENFGSKMVLSKIGMAPESDVDLYNCEELENYSIEAPYA
ncbi:MAG: GNAT family N-acetyltransferase [Saccharospirillum sp.]|uniref:GNAT family N-acetyltransferase n=1 Tax=Saccharospirillum sp. TaxID=2033801 RepID=UPI003296B025